MFSNLEKSLKRQLRSFARTFGCDLRRATAMNLWEYRLPRLFNDRGIRTVLDVGANEGQYAGTLLENGFHGTVISFEPLPGPRRRLAQKAAAAGGRWIVADPIALSDQQGEVTFYEAANSVSSSLLPMCKTHLNAAPESFLRQQTNVKAIRLDQFLAEHRPESPLLLKLDVQGAEMQVLRGSGNALREAIAGVQVEMSLQILYEDQPLYWEMDCFLRGAGFECCDVIPEFRDPQSLHLLQYDGIYFRKRAS